MKFMRILLAIHFSFFCFHASLFSQYREVGTWRYYTNSTQFKDLEKVDKNLFVNAKRLLFDVKINPIEVSDYDKTSGLADYSISTIAYGEKAKKLFVIYENSMMDIISFQNGQKKITSNFDIYNKLIVGDKTITQIKFYRDRAYFCSKLGIILLNYERNEIEDSYIIGSGGQLLAVHTLEILDDKIYASTDMGVKVGEIKPAINLKDFNNWSAPLSFVPNDTFFRSSLLANNLYWLSKYSFVQSDASNAATLIVKDTLRVMKQLRKLGDKLYIIYDSLNIDKSLFSTKVLKYDGQNFEIIKTTNGERLFDIQEVDGKFYYTGNGFLENAPGQELKKYRLNDYPWDNPFRLSYQNRKVFVNMGVMNRPLDASLNKDGYFTYGPAPWSRDNFVWLHGGIWADSLRDCTNEIATVERDGGKYRAFVRGGVAFEKEGSPLIRYRKNNSTLEEENGTYSINDMVLNPVDQSIWIVSKTSKDPLKCITKEGKWYSFKISSVTNTNQIYRIIIDQIGNKWLLTRNEGVILFNEMDIANVNDDVVRQYLEIKDKNCKLSIQYPYCGVVDKENNLWIGSEKGVGMLTTCTYDPERECFMSIPIQQIVNPNDTTRYTECVFLNTAVTALAVDAGNRLWVGTSDGIFYNNEYLSDEFIKLNKLNSPFSIQSVHDILVHPLSGEVFITTEVGLLSYMGQSTSAELNESLSPYRVIPNPVPRDFEGLITIDGLPDGGYFKITDVIGNVMYQGHANGSRVTWDTRSLNGYKVPTGVYYIFSSRPQMKGKQGVGSFTIVR
jgi:hypothetical protein